MKMTRESAAEVFKTINTYLKRYIEYAVKETNKDFYLDKKDYLKASFSSAISYTMGSYDKKTRTIDFNLDEIYHLTVVGLNGLIVHEFGHALYYDCFDSQIPDVHDGPEAFSDKSSKNEKVQEYFACLLGFFDGLREHTRGNDAELNTLANINDAFNNNRNPMDLLDQLFEYRSKLKLNLEGLKKVNLKSNRLEYWLAYIVGKDVEEIRKYNLGENSDSK